MSDRIADARKIIIEVASELATGKWLVSDYKADHPGAISKEVLRKLRRQNDDARKAAMRLRQAFDLMGADKGEGK